MTRSSVDAGVIGAPDAREMLAGTVRHLHGDVEVWEAMVRGWAAQQASRGLAGSTVDARERIVRQFQRYTNAFPWAWTPADVEEFTATLRAERRVSHSTVRCYQGAVRLFVDYVADGRSGWPTLCSERFGSAPVQVCHEWNTVVHASEFEGRPTGRALSRSTTGGCRGSGDLATTGRPTRWTPSGSANSTPSLHDRRPRPREAASAPVVVSNRRG